MSSMSCAAMLAMTLVSFMLLVTAITATRTTLATKSQQQQQQDDRGQEQLDLVGIKSISNHDGDVAELLPSLHTNSNTNNNNNNNDGVNNDLFVQQGADEQRNDDVYIASLVNSQGNLNININPNMDDYNIQNNALDAEQNGEETTFPPPVFDFGMPRNITARTGQTAAINCRVENLGDKSVSWIRKRDLHILTAGILTYTSDERFKVVRTADSKDWTLHVKYAQPRDTGIYECQVNTEPKISMAFRLNVIVTPPDAKAIIAGPADLYVKVGSVITLTCHVKQPSATAQDIGPIYWYRGQYVLTPFVAHPNDAAIDLQRISMESTLAEKLQSRLRIANAQLVDSGNYTCMPTTAEAASVMVNVINDESPAAMQKSGAKSSWCCGSAANMFSTTMVSLLTINTVVRWLCQLQQQQQQQQRLLYLIHIALCAFCALFVHIKYPIRMLFEQFRTVAAPTATIITTTTTAAAAITTTTTHWRNLTMSS